RILRAGIGSLGHSWPEAIGTHTDKSTVAATAFCVLILVTHCQMNLSVSPFARGTAARPPHSALPCERGWGVNRGHRDRCIRKVLVAAISSGVRSSCQRRDRFAGRVQLGTIGLGEDRGFWTRL